jgi:hypothetical protein
VAFSPNFSYSCVNTLWKSGGSTFFCLPWREIKGNFKYSFNFIEITTEETTGEGSLSALKYRAI